MTELQKSQIVQMRSRNMGYKTIAARLGISRELARYYCRQIDVPVENKNVCRNCGKPITQTPHKKEKLFCCDECRNRWWAKNSILINRSKEATYSYVCPVCGKTFTAYGNNHRKYCSHPCYITARFGEKRK